MSLKSMICVEYNPTPQEILKLFWDMDSDDMAQFFNDLGCEPNLMFQLQYVTDSAVLNGGGRAAMALIGEYAGKKS